MTTTIKFYDLILITLNLFYKIEKNYCYILIIIDNSFIYIIFF